MQLMKKQKKKDELPKSRQDEASRSLTANGGLHNSGIHEW